MTEATTEVAATTLSRNSIKLVFLTHALAIAPPRKTSPRSPCRRKSCCSVPPALLGVVAAAFGIRWTFAIIVPMVFPALYLAPRKS